MCKELVLGCLDVGRSEGLDHLIGGEGASGVSSAADNLALGDLAQLSCEVVFGLGGRGVNALVVLAVTEIIQNKKLIFIIENE